MLLCAFLLCIIITVFFKTYRKLTYIAANMSNQSILFYTERRCRFLKYVYTGCQNNKV